MAKNKITSNFRLFSLLFVLIATLASKALQLTYLWSASDITVPLALVYVFRYSYMILGIAATAGAVSTTVYAYSYFGKKTCITTSLISLACLFSGKVTMFVYNLLANELKAAQLISGALSYLVEVLFDVLILLAAIILSGIYARKRDLAKKESTVRAYSPLNCTFLSASLYYVFLIIDLSVMNVIPFFVKYSDPTASEIKSIISDYMYYALQIPVIILLSWMCFALLTKATGKLKAKQYYHKNEGTV